jgi:hypothetical protein
MATTTIYLFIPSNGGEVERLCGDCCPVDGDGGQSEGTTPGYGDDSCECCGVPDWEPDEEEEED